jgi:hypothetical protein
VEFGGLYDVTEGVDSEVARLALGLKIHPSRDWRIFSRYESALSGSPDPANRNDVARLGAEFMRDEGLSCAASARWIGIAQSIASRPDEFIASAGYTLPWDHTLSGEMRWMRLDDVSDYETDLRITYEIPFNAPISRRGGLGSLSGTVSDATEPGLPGLPDVVITLGGLTAVTDSRGEYEFRSVPQGEYHLMADPASLGPDRVPSAVLPRKVVVTEGEESTFHLDITRPGRIYGAVLVDASKDEVGAAWGIEGSGGPPALLIKASCDGQVRRQLTDSDGRFSFDGLRPGRWEVTVARDGLPRLHTIDQDTFVVDVGSGTTDRIEVNVSSPPLVIPIIDTGDIRLSGTGD